MALPITIPYTFANATSSIPLSNLDTDFTTVANAINGIGNGTVALSNVVITGGIISNVSGLSTSSIANGTSNVSIATANGSVTVATAGTIAMTIDTSQNVGIGTTSPTQKLDVNGSINVANNMIVASGYGYNFGPTSAGLYISGNTTTNYMAFNTSSTERMRLFSSGNLLINRTTDTLGGGSQLAVVQGSAGWTQFLKTNNSSGLGITNTSGTVSYTAIGFYNNGETYSSCGIVTVSGTTTTYGTSSDYRMKENVEPMTTGLAKVAALKPVTYDWISTQEKGEGFIAHELAKVIPLAVVGEKDAVNENGSIKPQNVDYSKIVVHLVAAIQELSAKNDALEARLAKLETV